MDLHFVHMYMQRMQCVCIYIYIFNSNNNINSCNNNANHNDASDNTKLNYIIFPLKNRSTTSGICFRNKELSKKSQACIQRFRLVADSGRQKKNGDGSGGSLELPWVITGYWMLMDIKCPSTLLVQCGAPQL